MVLFDGVCNLCNASVNWVIDRDHGKAFRFVPLQTPAGRAIVERIGRDPNELSTLVAVEAGEHSIRSDAALRVGRRLGPPWSRFAAAARFLPRPVRDLGYRFVAASRYRVFGKRAACRVPTPELQSRFLDGDDIVSALSTAGFDTTART